MYRELMMVEEFAKASGNPVATTPTVNLPDRLKLLRVRLILGEVAELTDALHGNDLVETADALCDLLYVVLGTVATLGMQNVIKSLFEEVHRSNMTKSFKDNPADECGSRVSVKGPGYQPPRLAKIIDDYLDTAKTINSELRYPTYDAMAAPRCGDKGPHGRVCTRERGHIGSHDDHTRPMSMSTGW